MEGAGGLCDCRAGNSLSDKMTSCGSYVKFAVYMSCVCSDEKGVVFFFFQAEDGIRGVRT